MPLVRVSTLLQGTDGRQSDMAYSLFLASHFFVFAIPHKRQAVECWNVRPKAGIRQLAVVNQ